MPVVFSVDIDHHAESQPFKHCSLGGLCHARQHNMELKKTRTSECLVERSLSVCEVNELKPLMHLKIILLLQMIIKYTFISYLEFF